MADPKPVTLTQIDTGDYEGPYDPQPLLVVGNMPDPVAIPVAAFVAVDATPADATAVATDLIAVRAALISAGLMAAS